LSHWPVQLLIAHPLKEGSARDATRANLSSSVRSFPMTLEMLLATGLGFFEASDLDHSLRLLKAKTSGERLVQHLPSTKRYRASRPLVHS